MLEEVAWLGRSAEGASRLLRAIARLPTKVKPSHVAPVDYLDVGEAIVNQNLCADQCLTTETTGYEDWLALVTLELFVGKLSARRNLHLAFHLDISRQCERLACSENQVRKWDVDSALDSIGDITTVADIDDQRFFLFNVSFGLACSFAISRLPEELHR